jgi:ParB family chromosome partitioning protein
LTGDDPLILTPEAFAAAPTLAVIAGGQHPTARSLADALGRDEANLSKTLKAYEQAGWITREKGQPPAITDAGREVLAALDRANAPAPAPDAGEGLRDLPISLVHRNPQQPRKVFAEAELLELAASIRDKGVLQPILVRPSPVAAGEFEIVAGERRWRAALAADLSVIPALVRMLDDDAAFEAATIENVQRADMTEIEEAHAFARIVRDRMGKDPDLTLKATKEAIAERLKKTVRYVELRMQLLQLPEAKQKALEDGEISVTDARKWLQQRPKPLNLTPRQWLIALELFDAQERRPAEGETAFSGAATLVRPEAADDADLEALMALPAGLVSEVREIVGADGIRTGVFAVRFFEHRLDQLRLKFGGVDHDDARQGAMSDARAAVFGDEPAGVGQDGYVTEWLNGPFEPSAEALAQIAEEREAARAQAEARAQAQREAQARQEAEAKDAVGRLVAVLTLGARLDAKPPKPLDPLFAQVFAATGRPLPLYPTPLAGLVAANGVRILADYPPHAAPPADAVARIALLAMAVNAAAGLATPQAPPVEEGADLRDVGEEAEDAGVIGEVEPEPEDEEDGEVEDAADAPEFSPALLKLVGVRNAPAHP